MSLLLKALRCENLQRPPVWLMRQAGRYMPEYRAIRQKYSFLEMCHNPELVTEITQQPIKAFGMDAAILFSDILVIPEAFGLGLSFEDNIGPILSKPIQTVQQIQSLSKINAQEQLQYVADSIKLLKPELKVPLLGFAGAPFTVASYMIEGGSSKTLKKTKQWLFKGPTSFHLLLDKITEATLDYLNLQIDAGVDAIQIFDSWANYLGHTQFREFSLNYLKKISVHLAKKNIPLIIFCKGSSVFAPQIAEINPSAISLDWNSDLLSFKDTLPKTIALQGNLDPDLLYAPHKEIEKEVNRLIKGMQNHKGYIVNLGHGIHPDTPLDAVKCLIDCVKASSHESQ